MTIPGYDPRWGTRVVLLLGIVSGISYAGTTWIASPEQFGLASNVYVTAGEAILASEDPYAVSPADLPGYQFLYPPIVLGLFVPYALLGGATLAYLLQTATNIIAAAGIVLMLFRGLNRRDISLTVIDQWLIVGFVFASSYGIAQFIMGQTTLWLALGLAVGFDALDRDEDTLAGVAFGLSALIKVFPAVIGLYLLRRRSFSAIGAAIATGLAGIALGLVLLGLDLSNQYFFEVLLDRYHSQTFDGSVDPSASVGGIRRQLAGLLGMPAAYMSIAAAAILVPILAICYRRIDSDVTRQSAILATLVTMLLFFPLQPLYFPLVYFPLVVLLYRLEGRRVWLIFAAGMIFTFLMIDYAFVVAVTEQLMGPLDRWLIAVADAVFGVALLPDIGMWLWLLGCIIVQYRSHQHASTDPIA